MAIAQPDETTLDGIFSWGLPTDHVVTAAAYRYWAQTLVPAYPSALITLTSGRPWDATIFNDSARQKANDDIRHIINIIDRIVYGKRYVSINKELRFPFFARGETHSKTGGEVHLHWHIVLAKHAHEHQPFDQGTLDKITQNIEHFYLIKSRTKVDCYMDLVGPEPEHYGRIRGYTTKKIIHDAELIFTRRNYKPE